VNWRLFIVIALAAVLALWAAILLRSPPYPTLPKDVRAADFEIREPSLDQLEVLRRSIEAAAKKRGAAAAVQRPKAVEDAGPSAAAARYDAGAYESWVDQELLRRAETGESIPTDGSFDPLEALERLQSGESREQVLGRQEAQP
jgi:hypothetical protein